MAYFIKNWDRFQHYKNKKPGVKLPWVKLYRDLLEDPEWFKLDGQTAKTIIMLWILASDTDGALPSAEKICFRIRIRENDLTTAISKLSHWVYSDSSETLEPVYSASRQEEDKEKEEEKEEEEEKIKTPLTPQRGENEFDAFWELYPRKIGKEAARKAWNHKLKGKSLPCLEELRAAVAAQKQSPQWTKDGGQFIPHPATWLNQGRWLDEVEIQKEEAHWSEIQPLLKK